jgi:uncharacterized protein YmfQ (DUF2313 family)
MAEEDDRHIRRPGSDYRDAFLQMLPQGQAWPKVTVSSVLFRTVDGLCNYWGYVDGRAGDLLEIESDPRTTSELLPDWERNWGLPDPCLPWPPPEDEETRRDWLLWKYTLLGGQSRAFFIDIAHMLHHKSPVHLGPPVNVAHPVVSVVSSMQFDSADPHLAAAGDHIITITEYSPYMCGVSHVGDRREIYNPEDPTRYYWQLGPPEIRFYWTVHAGPREMQKFYCGFSQCGTDRLLYIDLAEDLECILERLKPAHTDVVFDYIPIWILPPDRPEDTCAIQPAL